jgi:hypothetical protein
MTYENFGNIIRNMWQNILDKIKEQRWMTNGNLGEHHKEHVANHIGDMIKEQMWPWETVGTS